MFAVDPRKVKETGYPRNDIMFWSDAKKELSKLLPIDVYNSKLFFYLPTMRKGLKGEGEQFDDNIFNYLDYDADEIDWFLEKNNAYIVLLKNKFILPMQRSIKVEILSYLRD